MRIMIVGGGEEAPYLARSLGSRGHAVTLVNRDAEECLRLSALTAALVIRGDGTLPRVLEEAGIGATDRLLALTPRDEDNYLICRLCALRYRVAATFALVHDPENEEAFHELGIAGTFSATLTLSSLIEQRAASPAIRSLQPLAEGRVSVTEILIPPRAPSVGKALRDMRLPASSLAATILRDGEVIVPNGETVLAAGDKLSFICLPERHGEALRALLGGS